MWPIHSIFPSNEMEWIFQMHKKKTLGKQKDRFVPRNGSIVSKFQISIFPTFRRKCTRGFHIKTSISIQLEHQASRDPAFAGYESCRGQLLTGFAPTHPLLSIRSPGGYRAGRRVSRQETSSERRGLGSSRGFRTFRKKQAETDGRRVPSARTSLPITQVSRGWVHSSPSFHFFLLFASLFFLVFSFLSLTLSLEIRIKIIWL